MPQALSPGEVALVRHLCAEAERLLLRDQFDEAREAVNHALRLDPGHAAAVHILGVIEMENGSPEKAIQLIKRSAALDPEAYEPHYYLGRTLAHLGRYEEAAAAFRKALEIQPDLLPVLEELGSTLQSLGRQDQAKEVFRHAIALDPARLAPYHHLADIDPTALTGEEISMLERIFADPAEAMGRVATCGFTLAAVYDHRRDYDAAFAHLKRANDLVKALLVEGKGEAPPGMVAPGGEIPRRLDPADALAEVARTATLIETTYTPEFFQRYRGFGHPSRLPVFVLGMPRSGSTLVEQLLASHPKVYCAGERADFHEAVATIEGRNPPTIPAVVPTLTGDQLQRLGALYVSRMSADAPQAERITDKMPGNFVHAGLIHLALPNARIIHTRRDPVDTCFSCFARLFTQSKWYTYDLGELGRYYRGYQQLMEHWRRILPEGAMLEVQYEDVVADTEGQARRILGFCGLPWDDRCLAFYKHPRPIKTASVSQVRRPIYSSSVGKARIYGDALRPLIDELNT